MPKTTPLRIEYSSPPDARIAKRRRFAWVFMLALSALYLAFLILVAFEPELLGTLVSGSTGPLVWGLGLFLLVLSFGLATLHFKNASRDFESMNDHPACPVNATADRRLHHPPAAN